MSTITVLMATKVGKLVTCQEGLPLHFTTPFDHVVLQDYLTLISWSDEITRQTKIITSPLPQYL